MPKMEPMVNRQILVLWSTTDLMMSTVNSQLPSQHTAYLHCLDDFSLCNNCTKTQPRFFTLYVSPCRLPEVTDCFFLGLTGNLPVTTIGKYVFQVIKFIV